jgi:hypothetical protein
MCVGLFTLIRGGVEYRRQGTQTRADLFLRMRDRWVEFNEVCVLLGKTDAQSIRELKEIPFQRKQDFLGLYEEIALLTNSGMLRPQAVYYMFGYYALRCDESDAFWNSINRHSMYWLVFNDFVQQMKAMERKSSTRKFNRRAFKL